jgi:RNA polymerase sigma-32 factor
MASKPKLLTPEEEKTASVDELVLSHAPLVYRMAHNFSRYGVDRDDLIQEGNIALLIAAERFDRERGLRFSTYAMFWIRQRMQDLVMNLNSIVRRPLSTKFKSGFFKNRPRTDVSTETPIGFDGLTLGDTLVSPDAGPDAIVEEMIEAEAAKKAIRRGMRFLNSREREIVAARHLGDKPETLESLGSKYGVTRERIRQIEERALQKLREEIVNG